MLISNCVMLICFTRPRLLFQTNTPALHTMNFPLAVFQVCVSSAAGSELLSRHERSWIIDSFTIEEENPGPFPYDLGKVRHSDTQSNKCGQSLFQQVTCLTRKVLNV